MIHQRLWLVARNAGRHFSHNVRIRSGHNRWSKIKHDKAKADASVSKRNAAISTELIRLSKAFGPDPQLNTALAQLIASAKKQGYPKQQIEHAISRGQGISASGAAFENVTIEAMLPLGVAAIIECQTDSKARTLSDLRVVITKGGGSTAPTSHLFERKGKVVFANPKSLSEDELFEAAIDAGATGFDVINENKIRVFTDPSSTTMTISTLKKSVNLEALSSEIIWVPKEETATPDPGSGELDQLIEKIEEDDSVQAIYLNTLESIDSRSWNRRD